VRGLRSRLEAPTRRIAHVSETAAAAATGNLGVAIARIALAAMLHEFVTVNRDEIIRRCSAKVAMRAVASSTEPVEHGVPLFLDQLVDALRLRLASGLEIGDSAVLHGRDMRRQGFTVSQVVHVYGDICQSITGLAVETSTPISPDDFGLMSACLDNAMAGAVTEYQHEARSPAWIP